MSILSRFLGKNQAKKSKPKKKVIKPSLKRIANKPAKATKKQPTKKMLRKRTSRKTTKRIQRKEELIGVVTHYFPKVKAGVIQIKKGTLNLSDTLHIKGHTTDFKQKVSSIQIENKPIKIAKKGQEIGLRVKSKVRHNDLVYKLKQ